MKRKDTRDLMMVIWIIWFVVTAVILMGWLITSENVYDPVENRKITTHDEDWNSMLKIGTIGVFGLGVLVFMSPSPENGERK